MDIDQILDDSPGLPRRTLLAGAMAASLLATEPARAGEAFPAMYGRIGRMLAHPGQRAALIAAILGSGTMPGCLSYVVAEDGANADAIWISEVWDGKASHDASLALPAVRAAIATARPLIAGFDSMVETHPVGGIWIGAR